jgi:hypothetical protein
LFNITSDTMGPQRPKPNRHPDFMIGFTTDSGWENDCEKVAIAAANCPKKPWVRIVFDAGVKANEYRPGVELVAAVANIVGEPVDSYNFQHYPSELYLERFKEYVGELGHLIPLWEVGNEINGEWLADYVNDANAAKSVAKTVTKAQLFVESQGAKSLVTYYLNPNCFEHTGNLIFTWMRANPMPPPWLAGLSYYDDDCSGDLKMGGWQSYVERFAEWTQAQRIAITECGTVRRSRKQEFLTRYGEIIKTVSHPRWCGGGFWWYGRQDFSPPGLNTKFALFKKWFDG